VTDMESDCWTLGSDMPKSKDDAIRPLASGKLVVSNLALDSRSGVLDWSSELPTARTRMRVNGWGNRGLDSGAVELPAAVSDPGGPLRAAPHCPIDPPLKIPAALPHATTSTSSLVRAKRDFARFFWGTRSGARPL
jgi:hypothetical protein